MDVDEDGAYSDDDLDALPSDTFQRLEEHAVTSTQQAPGRNNALYHPAAGLQTRKPGLLTGGLERLSVGGNPALQEDSDFPQQPSSDYGDLDDDMLDGEIYDAAQEPGISPIQASRAANLPYTESTQRELWRIQRYGKPPPYLESAFPHARVGDQLQNVVSGPYPKRSEAETIPLATNNAHHDTHSDLETLQAQILEVRRT